MAASAECAPYNGLKQRLVFQEGSAQMGKMSKELKLNMWVHVYPAEDVPGQWVSHCLDVDVVSQGDTLVHALMMGIEASAMVIAEDIKNNEEPLFRRAPAEYWKALNSLHRNATARQISIQEMEKVGANDNIEVFANIAVNVRLEANAHEAKIDGDGDDPVVAYAKQPQRDSLPA